MSQPALGCLKVCYDVDKLLFLPSLHDYRLAIGYLHVENGGVGGGNGYQSVRCKLRDHSLLLCFGVSL